MCPTLNTGDDVKNVHQGTNGQGSFCCHRRASPEFHIKLLEVTVTQGDNVTSEGFRIEYIDKLILLVADFRPSIKIQQGKVKIQMCYKDFH